MHGKQKMKRAVVHIGPPKTGTTTLQNTLMASAEQLAEAGVYFPKVERNHRFLASHCMNRPEEFDYNRLRGFSQEQSVAHSQSMLDRVLQANAFSTSEVIIFSSEHLTLLKSPELATLKRLVGEIADEIQIVAFARHPVLQSVSLLQEGVKNGARRLADVLERPPVFKFTKLFEKWLQVFGRDALTVLELPERSSTGPDLVDTFCEAIDIDRNLLQDAPAAANPSLSWPALLIADALSEFAPKFSGKRHLQPFLQRIEGPKFHPDQEVVSRIMELAEPEIRYLSEKFGLEFRDDQGIEPAPASPLRIPKQTLRSLAVLLNELAEKSRQP